MQYNLEYLKYWRIVILCTCTCLDITNAITMQQFDQSLEMMRNGCAPKFKVTTEMLDKLRGGTFIEGNMDLMCYSKCVAQLAGTLTKKGDFSVPKALAQVPIILPPEIQDTARGAIEACKDIQKNYKDSCERVYYITKCVHDFSPSTFKFP